MYMNQDTMRLTCRHPNVSAFPTQVSEVVERARELLRNHTTPNVTNKKQTRAPPLQRL